jgi:hypothetical protein
MRTAYTVTKTVSNINGPASQPVKDMLPGGVFRLQITIYAMAVGRTRTNMIWTLHETGHFIETPEPLTDDIANRTLHEIRHSIKTLDPLPDDIAPRPSTHRGVRVLRGKETGQG